MLNPDNVAAAMHFFASSRHSALAAERARKGKTCFAQNSLYVRKGLGVGAVNLQMPPPSERRASPDQSDPK